MRISINGFTPAHQGRGNRKNIVQIPLTLIESLRNAGHEADYKLENADLYIIYIFTLSSLNSGHTVECLEIIKNNPGKVILSIDDWRIKHIYEGMEKTIKSKKFSKTHPSIDYKGVLDNLDTLQKIVDGDFNTIIPAHNNGNHSLLEARGDITIFDPSIYVQRDRMEFDNKYDLFPVHASLAANHRYLDKRNYSYIQVQNEKEDKVWELYNKHRIVMSPPYYHSGSGWWRNRYSLANAAHAVIIEDENSVFGPAYEIIRKDVNENTIDFLWQQQDKAYKNIIMSNDENVAVLNKLIESMS